MRIVGGELGGRRFEPPTGLPARPTTDRARESLFNILTHMADLGGIRMLDLFSGTGAMSYEAVSRGAIQVTAVEKDAASCGFIQKTAAAFGIADRLRVQRADAFKALQALPEPVDLVFADPPYALPQMTALPALLLVPSVLKPNGLLVLEHSTRTHFDGHPARIRAVAYGDSAFSFFRPH